MSQGTVPKISVRGVKKSFGPKVVLDGVDIDCAAAESLVIIGGSGTDVAVFSGAHTSYLISYDSATQTFTVADQRAGYGIERAAVFDIGGGFVMDDFIMTLPVSQEAPVAVKDSAANP